MRVYYCITYHNEPQEICDSLLSSLNSQKNVDLDKFEPLEEYINTHTKMRFRCKIHDLEFTATAPRCFGCDICKKEHHYKWKKDWRHIGQEEIIKRCQAIQTIGNHQA